MPTVSQVRQLHIDLKILINPAPLGLLFKHKTEDFSCVKAYVNIPMHSLKYGLGQYFIYNRASSKLATRLLWSVHKTGVKTVIVKKQRRADELFPSQTVSFSVFCQKSKTVRFRVELPIRCSCAGWAPASEMIDSCVLCVGGSMSLFSHVIGQNLLCDNSHIWHALFSHNKRS